ncbi:MAG TPA: hypothetical protein VGU61_10150 [Noviherbaspirillum sp.]|jgi:hypothetical protein|uniref:hypothetical protein n=1 Tax=Noviherbaspirillum sp. TaxID=1926288 RepID=UPI002DDC90AE|nr:hypothetical protein [Noviherbaspirillum sp.]HEV2610616.1 hypothetical protein [Noviherbaspirillum sp.]
MKEVIVKEIDLRPIKRRADQIEKILRTVDKFMKKVDNEVYSCDQYYSDIRPNINCSWAARADHAAILQIEEDILVARRALKMLLPSLQRLNVIASEYIDQAESPRVTENFSSSHTTDSEDDDDIPF